MCECACLHARKSLTLFVAAVSPGPSQENNNRSIMKRGLWRLGKSWGDTQLNLAFSCSVCVCFLLHFCYSCRLCVTPGWTKTWDTGEKIHRNYPEINTQGIPLHTAVHNRFVLHFGCNFIMIFLKVSTGVLSAYERQLHHNVLWYLYWKLRARFNTYLRSSAL